MTPVIGITTYEDQASWRGWSARAAMLPYVYVEAVRRSGAQADYSMVIRHMEIDAGVEVRARTAENG